MLTFKERKMIRNIVKQYHDKDWIPITKAVYEDIKSIPEEELLRKLDKKYHDTMRVNEEVAYRDLKLSHEKMRCYIENLAPERYITVNGITGPIDTIDITHCFFNASCLKAADVINSYLQMHATQDETERRVLIALVMIMMHNFTKWNSGENCSIELKVEKITAAEEQYGEKFFVNDWLYDTFTYPELFESYGVYKTPERKTEVYTLNKRNIIQDVL